MPIQVDAQELKEGLTIFRRGDVKHENWYCRIKLPRADRYKTVSLKTADVREARNKAFDQDAEVRFSLKHDVPVFQKSFSQVAKENMLISRRSARKPARSPIIAGEFWTLISAPN